MKKFVRFAIAALLVAGFSSTTYSQTNITYEFSGRFQWVCPIGVDSVTLQLWGAGSNGTGSNSGGGGAFVQTTSIPVQAGVTYIIKVASNQDAFLNDSLYSSFGTANTVLVKAYSADINGILHPQLGAPASSGQYVAISYGGGDGGYNQYSGAAAGSSCGKGANGQYAFNGVVNGGLGICGAGSGGDYNGSSYNGRQPGGGGASGFGGYPVGNGGYGEVILTYTCNANAGQITNAHTITYPPEMAPDSIKNISYTGSNAVTFLWQQSTDNSNFVTAKNNVNALSYRFDLDSTQTTTYYRRLNNGCTSDNSFGNATNTIQIKVFNSTNGRNGKITGYVQSRNGTAIANRKVYAQSLTPLKGRSVGFLDSAYTDDQGKFIIDSVFYGDKNNGDSATVRFNVYPDTSYHHSYNPSSIKLSLSASNPQYDITQHFLDTTTFAVTGQVTQICYGCLNGKNKADTITGTVDSVKIVGIGQNNNINHKEADSTYTGWQKPPGKYGSYGLIYQEIDNYTVTPTFKNNKIIPKDTTFYVDGNVSNINFVDTTTHVISGFFGAGCNDVIGTAVLEFYDSLPYKVNGKVKPSEFRKRVTTDSLGNYSIRLPARAYNVKIISVNVKDPIDPSTKQSTIISYFNAQPASSKYKDITTNNKTLNLIYHRAPQMAVSGLYDDSSRVANCSAFKNYDFWPQSVKRPITFTMYQGPVSRGCLLDTGTVYVTTDISSTVGVYNNDTVKFANGIGVDSIVAAQPNTVINAKTGTYSKKFSATYTDIINRSVSTDTSKPALPIIIVTGAAVDPSGTNFVTVSPQIPLLVLHDPPGSNSFSKWSQEVKSSQAVSFKAEKENTEGGFVNVTLGLSEILGLFVESPIEFWAKVDNNFSTTNTTTNTTESVITNTSEQEIETADDVAYIESDADLIYGAALNINYKIGTQIDWDSAACKVLDPKPVMVMDIKNDTTSFLYTQGYIKNQEIPRLQIAAAAQTNPDSVAYFNNQIKVWQQLIDNNEANIKAGQVLQNLSFSNGTSQSYSNTLENSSTNTYDFDLSLNQDVAISLGFEIAGTGVDGGYNVGFKMTTGTSISTENSTSTTTSYTLADNNAGGPTYEGDYLSVNVKKDPVYGTPMFEAVAGGTQCPHEEGTIALDHSVITADVTNQTNIKKDTANFTLYLNNLSYDATPNGKRPYILFLNAASNPSGATVLIGGTSSPDGVTYVIPNNGGVQPVTVSVIRNTSSGVYTYNDLEFIMTDPCFPPVVQGFFSNPHEYSSIILSADFQSPVSNINLVSPVNNWVANQASNNIIPITFNGYDTTKLTNVTMQYSVPGTGNWLTGFTIQRKNLGKTSTTQNWNISTLADGAYIIRLKVKDKNNNVIYSRSVKGTIDRQPPQLFGTPQPANAIYTAGTQISFSYTENINTTLKSSMAELRDMTTNKKADVDLSAYNNTIIITPQTSIAGNIGDLYRVIMDSVVDIHGNLKTSADTIYFTVNPSVFATGADALSITSKRTSIYEDAAGTMDVKFTRNSPATTPIVMYYNICGNTNYITDYTVNYNAGQTDVTNINGATGTILLPKDSSSVTMYIKPVNDSVLSPDKKITFTLSAGGGYSIGSKYAVTDTILNHNTVPPIITADKSTTLCSGDSVTLSTSSKINGVAVASYLWSTGSTKRTITVKKSGSYTVKVTDVNGLVGYSAPTVVTFICGSPVSLSANVLDKKTAVLRWDTVLCAKKYVLQYRQSGKKTWTSDTVISNIDSLKNLKPNTTYEWQVASICQYPQIIMSSYTAGANFTTPASFTDVAVSNTADYTKAAAGDGFSAGVYPNPATTNATLEVKGMKGNYSVVITNLQGTTLWKAENLQDASINLPINNLSGGIYMITIVDKEHIGRLKLIKQ
ncbi:MAG: T9SS type A sorting domain-containing protein [Parafilimonas sp.]|nr:T9SS type A sorting domain-containing protein [Parafilimonas sp.]